MTDTMRCMARSNVQSFCITCNTLHVLEGKIRQFLAEDQECAKLEFVSIVGAVGKALEKEAKRRASNGPLKVAVLGSLVTTDIEHTSPYRHLAKVTKNVELVPVSEMCRTD